MDKLESARDLFLSALEHHNHQRLGEAEALYRHALELVPERMSVLNNLAAVLIGQSRFAEALTLCERGTAIDPGNTDAQANAAACRRELANPEHALRLLDAALQADPGDVQAHANRGGLLQQLGRLQDALASYDHALGMNPDDLGMLANRGVVLARLGRMEEAFACFRRALQIDPQFDQAGEGFTWLVTMFGFLPARRDADFDAMLIRAIREPWARPAAVAPVIIAILRADPTVGTSLEHVARNWPAQMVMADVLPEGALFALSANSLLTALLENAVVADLSFARWLGLLREKLTARSALRGDAHPPAAEELALHCALARQCFINEYVFPASADEQADVSRLRGRLIDALVTDEPFPANALAAVASHFPLSTLADAERLLEREWPEAVEALLTQQVREPLQEQRNRARIARLTVVADDVSLEVRQQYEENPYPRWVATPRLHRRESLQGYLRGRVSAGEWRSIGEVIPVEVLNAGCGTGQNPIETAQRIANARVLAVDLSLASLSYAMRKAEQLGVTNIEFAQADILQLASQARRFDLIESTGVLHHLHDPEQGLRILRSLLYDHGVMKLALYSQAARRPVVATRALIDARGYGPSALDIRRCRDELMRMPADSLERKVTQFTDFHSLSECRDLLFHVQEHRFTIPGIRALLAATGLEFIGFERVDSAPDRAAAEPSANSLDGWEDHELRHPDTFAGMYQFWVQKSAAL